MSTLDNSLRHSSVGQAGSKSSASLLRLLAFTFATALLALIISWVVHPWTTLSWWKVFRRCVSISAAISLWGMLRFVDRASLRSLGFGAWSRGRTDMARGLSMGLAMLLLIGGCYLAIGACRISIHPDAWRLWRTIVGFIPAALLVGVLEEAIFRGYILHQLIALSTPMAIAGSSLSYAVVHLRGEWMWPSTALELAGLTVLGVVLALSRLKTGQLYLAIGLHASLAYGARVNKLLIEFPDSSMAWLVGTNRLINGIAAWVALMGVGWLITRWSARPSEGGVS
ncbi:MAG: CPBP family intramembrane metalloprotease [Candidatus Omnitrophica bacterium]|nr:CPBP family intramembrane metalloprotease [Candidatus Omnitrophota bacterium]